MNRSELERLDRDALIARAEAHGVTRARILTRPELVDELLLRGVAGVKDMREVQRARGLFGRARDLLARVVERGLHLPDAADRLRGRSSPPPPPRGNGQPLPTVTLAEIYAAQGHRDRAIDTLRDVLAREPDHAPARALLEQLEDASYQGPRARTLPPEEDEVLVAKDEERATPEEGEEGEEAKRAKPAKPEPLGMLDDAPLPTKYDVDECVAIPVDPQTLFVYWEVRDRTLEHLVAARAGGVLALRVLVVSPSWDGPATTVRDVDVASPLGDWFVRGLPMGAVVRAAIGWRVGDLFVPVAHSPALETPAGGPSQVLADVLVRWTPRGAEPIGERDRDAGAIERALGIAKKRFAEARLGGSSEMFASVPTQ